MKMRHIKKFNESNGNQELDFETFEHILNELEDEYDRIISNIECNDLSEDMINQQGEQEGYYDCYIEMKLFDPMGGSISGEYDYLEEILPPVENPQDIPNELINEIDEKINYMKRIISENELLKKLFSDIHRMKNRFENFSNYKSFSIGFDNYGQDSNESKSVTIRICFNIKD